jgi:uncharacterized protein YaiE (UPF0345 family)
VNHHVYFDGRVQSLSLHTKKGEATVGVIAAGAYTFSTAAAEHIVVTTGRLRVKIPDSDWREIMQGESIVVPPGSEFDVAAERDVSYVCYYGRHGLST